jgi:hypothetical protein
MTLVMLPMLVPIPAVVFVVPVSLGIIGLQVFGSYHLIVTTVAG